MRIVLYDYWRSSAAYRVRIALNLKGVAYERAPVNLLEGSQRSPENLARNAQGFVPTLEVDGRPLVQSLAIIDWLDANFPDPAMVSKDPFERADQLARALIIAADIHPIDNLRVLKRLESQFGVDQAGRDEWYRHWIGEGFDALEQMASQNGPFLGGDTLDLSDVCLVPQVANARRFEIDMARWPRLARAEAAMAKLEPVAAAHPDRNKP
jgi:maleylacetoacetate isomerase